MEQSRRPRINIDPSDLALEIVSTVIAILLALAVNNWAERQGHERTLRESLTNIRREVVSNRATLVAKMALHRHVEVAFQRFVDTHMRDGNVRFAELFVVFHRAAPDGFQGNLKQSDIAWRIAENGQAVADMPYDLRSLLTQTYDEQQTLTFAETRFFDAAFSSGAPSKDYFAEAFSARLWLGDTVYAEEELMHDYDRVIRQLPKT